MARFGKIAMLGTARRAAKRNASSVHAGIDKVASTLTGTLGSQHADKIEKGASYAKKAATGTDLPAGGGGPTGQ